MKKTIYVVLICFAISITSQSQTLINNSIELTAGYTPDGYAANINYNNVFDESYVKFGMYYSQSINSTNQGYKIPYDIFAINGGYYMSLFKSQNERIGLYGGVGISLGYEIVNNGNKELENGALIQSNSNFLYGGFGGFDLEYGLTPDFFILLNAKEYYHLNSDLGSATMYAGIGIKYFIN